MKILVDAFMDLLSTTEERDSEPLALRESLEQYLENFAIIPRGDNRHPYADIIHAYAEGVRCESNVPLIGWKDCSFDGTEYRIKPSEPIYEWQWKYKNVGDAYWVGFTVPRTDEEMNDYKGCPIIYERDESTKRIRQ